MVQVSEGTFQIGDLSLYTRTWLPDGPPKAKLVLLHGFSDHVNMYNDFGNALAMAGIAVHGVDRRGWGKSMKTKADRGKTGPTSQVIAEDAALIEAQLDAAGSVPVFVLGHSMGGAEVLTLTGDAAYEERVVARVRGWLLEAPFIGWPESHAPPLIKIVLGRFFSRFLPHWPLRHELPPLEMTRNAEVARFMAADEMCHDTGTLEGLVGLLDRTGDLESGKTRMLPSVKSLWLGHGTEDKGAGYTASKKWFEAQTTLEDKEFKTYDGWYHQLHSEPEREEYFGHVIEWILKRVPEGAERAEGAAPGPKL